MTSAKILIVDDEESIREVVAAILETQGYECVCLSNGQLARDYLTRHSVDLILSDMVMPEMLSLIHISEPTRPY